MRKLLIFSCTAPLLLLAVIHRNEFSPRLTAVVRHAKADRAAPGDRTDMHSDLPESHRTPCAVAFARPNRCGGLIVEFERQR